jgi:glycosyltransferase involved in cell wall biosynthesis
MALLATAVSAHIHQPDDSPATPLDCIRAKLLPTEAYWRLARRVQAQTRPSDIVYCSSEAGGFQLAAVCAEQKKRPRIAIFVHNIDRPRTRAAMNLWRLGCRVDLFLTSSAKQARLLREQLNLSEDRARHIWDHTDTEFFTPGPMTPGKKRPLIVSVGLEQRDYKTLAAATCEMDVDVKISGFSKDAAAMARTFPDPMPANMSRQFYEWPDLIQLYRDADVVIASCQENKYAAGVTTLMEAMACSRPVIATATLGLQAYLDGAPLLTTPVGDPQAMRRVIEQALNDPQAATQLAARGYELAQTRYNMSRYVQEIADSLRALR